MSGWVHSTIPPLQSRRHRSVAPQRVPKGPDGTSRPREKLAVRAT